MRWVGVIKHNKIMLLIFFLGALLRFVELDQLPAGLNQDEASAGYDAYALLTQGMDRNGYPYPVHLVAWGSGQNALYSYFAIPFIAAFDLSVFSLRVPAALLGSLAILLMYGFFAQWSTRTTALIAAFLVAISPWHIMMSRWALEANIFPTIVLAAATVLLYSRTKPALLYAFAVFMALALYAYGTAYLFVPLFMSGIFVFLLFFREITFKTVIPAYILAGVMALPIALFVMVNLYAWGPMVSAFGSIPRYTGTNRFTDITVMSSGEKVGETVNNLHSAARIIFSSLHDGSFYNSIAEYGYLYHCSLPFIVIGMGLVIWAWVKQRSSLPHFVILLWLLGAIAVCATLSVNFNRMNIIFYPLIMFAAIGIAAIIERCRSKSITALIIALFLINAGFFIHYYFGEYKEKIGESFFESFDQAIKAVDEVAPESETVYVTGSINMPYIAVLFHTRYDVSKYLATRKIPYMNTMFQSVTSFGQYVFGDPRAGVGRANCFVVHNSELAPFQNPRFIIRHFKYYSAVFSSERFRVEDGQVKLR